VIPFWGGRQANDKKPNLRFVFFYARLHLQAELGCARIKKPAKAGFLSFACGEGGNEQCC